MSQTPDTARPVFVVTLEAVEAGGAAEALTVLAFAQGETAEAAEARAVAELESFDWTAIRVLRSGEVTEPAALPEDFRDAMAGALRFGCALIVYDAP